MHYHSFFLLWAFFQLSFPVTPSFVLHGTMKEPFLKQPNKAIHTVSGLQTNIGGVLTRKFGISFEKLCT